MTSASLQKQQIDFNKLDNDRSYLLENKLLEDKIPDQVLEDIVSSDLVNQRGFEVTEKGVRRRLEPVTCYKNDNHYQFGPYLCRPQH